MLARALIGLGVAVGLMAGLNAIVLWFPPDRVALACRQRTLLPSPPTANQGLAARHGRAHFAAEIRLTPSNSLVVVAPPAAQGLGGGHAARIGVCCDWDFLTACVP